MVGVHVKLGIGSLEWKLVNSLSVARESNFQLGSGTASGYWCWCWCATKITPQATVPNRGSMIMIFQVHIRT